jgi:hypothetical protein
MRKKIENLITELEQGKTNAFRLINHHISKQEYSKIAMEDGKKHALVFTIDKLNKILNEAVVCGSQENHTMCERVDIYHRNHTNVKQYCLKCKKEFDFLGKEISS